MATVNIKKQDGSYERVADTLGAVVSQNVNYSIDEVRTGTWINGKPVYSRVYTFSPTTSNTASSAYNRTQYATLPADVEDVIKIEGTFIDDVMVLPLPWSMHISAARSINY